MAQQPEEGLAPRVRLLPDLRMSGCDSAWDKRKLKVVTDHIELTQTLVLMADLDCLGAGPGLGGLEDDAAASAVQHVDPHAARAKVKPEAARGAVHDDAGSLA